MTTQQHMQWDTLLSPERLGSLKKHNEIARSPFHKDYDRIIFSESFRQLNRKTQVHPLTQNDTVHTRLTHSLEVSCIGRSLGMLAAEKMTQLPPWVSAADIGAIIQAACLAHDIGNPPFGHAGEYAIREWFASPEQHHLKNHMTPAQFNDLCQYEGNAQGFRTLTRLAYHPEAGGMRLTYATLGAFLKYPWVAALLNAEDHKATKFGCYQTERFLLEQIAGRLGLLQTAPFAFVRHPLAYLLEAADDICYALIDLEDGLLLGMLQYAEVEPILLQLIGDYGLPEELTQQSSMAQKLAALRGRAMKRLVDEVTSTFARLEPMLLQGTVQHSVLTHCSSDIAEGIQRAKQLAKQKIFTHPDKARLELLAGASLHLLLDAFIPLTLCKQPKTFREQRLSLILQDHGALLSHENVYEDIMKVLDMITAFSDHQAYALSQQLSGHHMGQLN